ncbi:MAG TPA: hypothetical protein VF940_28170, partial [Streptosporangiaceae bacterium]
GQAGERGAGTLVRGSSGGATAGWSLRYRETEGQSAGKSAPEKREFYELDAGSTVIPVMPSL